MLPLRPTTTDDLLAAITTAHANNHTLHLQGSNSSARTPSPDHQPLITLRLNKLLHHDPSLRAVTAHAGITIDALQKELAYRGHWLPIDASAPNGRPSIHRTLGGLLATNAAGPLRSLRGGWPNLLLHASTITPTGTLLTHQSFADLVANPQNAIAEVTLRIIPPPADERALLLFAATFPAAQQIAATILALPQRPAYLLLASAAVFANNSLNLPAAPWTLVAGTVGSPTHTAATIETLRLAASQTPGDTLALTAAPTGRLRLHLSSEPAAPTSFATPTPTRNFTDTLNALAQLSPTPWLVADLLSRSLRGSTNDHQPLAPLLPPTAIHLRLTDNPGVPL